MSSLSNRELLVKYCYTDISFVQETTRDFLKNYANDNIIDFLADFFITFIYSFFKSKDSYPELRKGFNRLRSDFVKEIYAQMQNIILDNQFISKDFYDNYYYWLLNSRLCEEESGKAIADFQITNIFKEKYKILYDREYSDKQE